jgi:hypothetical protein
MKKFLLIAASMLPILCMSQVSIPPGKTITVTAEQCPPTQVTVHDTIWQCPPVTPQPTDTTKPQTSYGTLTYQNGYNYSTDINTGQGPLNKISTLVYVTAPGSFRTEAGDKNSYQSSGYRGEMQYNDAIQNPTEGVWEYDVYYENWKSFPGGGHSVQWHPNSSSGSAVLSLQNYGGYFNVVRSLNGTNSGQKGTLMQVIPNKWYRMRWEIKWGTSGYIRLYIDNTLYYSFTGQTSGGGVYFKLGQNRWSTTCNGCAAGPNSVVYYDNLKIYRK